LEKFKLGMHAHTHINLKLDNILFYKIKHLRKFGWFFAKRKQNAQNVGNLKEIRNLVYKIISHELLLSKFNKSTYSITLSIQFGAFNLKNNDIFALSLFKKMKFLT